MLMESCLQEVAIYFNNEHNTLRIARPLPVMLLCLTAVAYSWFDRRGGSSNEVWYDEKL